MVKEGHREQFGALLAPEAGQALIREAARNGLSSRGACTPLVLDLPIHGRLRLPDKSIADQFAPGRATRVNEPAVAAELLAAVDICEY